MILDTVSERLSEIPAEAPLRTDLPGPTWICRSRPEWGFLPGTEQPEGVCTPVVERPQECSELPGADRAALRPRARLQGVP